MGERPGGTLTFVFTDIEGSTRKWQEHGDAMRAALTRHDALVADAVEGAGGRIFKHTGDGVCAVFGSCGAAVGAAVEIERRVSAGEWSDVDGLAVRLGIHSGEADERDGDYFGTTLNRAARVMSAAHGGQALVSGATAALLRDDLPPGISLLDLGEHRLRDLAGAERLHQVVASGLRSDFPPPRAAVVEHNLPLPRTSFVGRAREVAAVVDLLGEARLVTLVGIGGTGKTRLALEVAALALDRFSGGAFFVDLSSLTDPTLIPGAVATALGLPPGPGVGAAFDAVLAVLASRRALVVLDNCEHLVDECADVVDVLLDRCPHVVVLATSREALDVEGERAWPVASLDEAEARRLFADRAAAADPRFAVTVENEAVVAEICRRLDGIPLALELAASRVAHLGLAELADHLDDRFRLLTGGRRRRAQRQQTLQAAIDWSHDLLDQPERTLLRRLSVFAGGFTLGAADAVCRDESAGDILGLLTSLVSKSLVVADVATGGTRYRLLETLRLYAADRLVEAGEAERFRSRHRDWYLAQLEAVAIDQLLLRFDLADRHALDIENYRVAIDWSEGEGRLDLVARFAIALGGVWAIGGYHDEGFARLRTLIADVDAVDPDRRADCLAVLAYVAMTVGDFDAMVQAADESLAIAPDGRLASMALSHAGLHRVFDPGRFAEAHELFAEARAAAAREGLGLFADAAAATEVHFRVLEGRYDEVIEFARSLSSQPTFIELNVRLASSAAYLLTGRPAEVLVEVDRAVGAFAGVYWPSLRADALLALGDRDGAVENLAEAAREHFERPFPLQIGDVLIAFASLALHDGDAERAARILETILRQAGVASFRSPSTFEIWRRVRAGAREALGKEAFDAARREADADAVALLRHEAARLQAGRETAKV